MLGILGGMGPLAAAEFQVRLIRRTPATCDQEHIPVIMLNDGRIPDRSNAVIDPTSPSPLPAMIERLRHLEAMGAEAIVIPCHTAHLWIDDMRSQIAKPIISLVDVTVADIADDPSARKQVGILGTAGTIKSRVYQNSLRSLGLSTEEFDHDVTERTQTIIALVKSGSLRRGARLLKVLLAEVEERVTHCVLACTELSLVKNHQLRDRFVIDPLDLLADACLRHFHRDRTGTAQDNGFPMKESVPWTIWQQAGLNAEM